MKKEMLINVLQPEECRIAILEDGVLEELYVERTSHESYVGNIYKGRIVNIEPSIQAAFVDFGVGRNGFLHVSDVEPAYYRHLEGYRDRDRDRDGGRGRRGRGGERDERGQRGQRPTEREPREGEPREHEPPPGDAGALPGEPAAEHPSHPIDLDNPPEPPKPRLMDSAEHRTQPGEEGPGPIEPRSTYADEELSFSMPRPVGGERATAEHEPHRAAEEPEAAAPAPV